MSRLPNDGFAGQSKDAVFQLDKYEQAYLLTEVVEEHLFNGTFNFYTKEGCLLRTLDEVMRAIHENNIKDCRLDKI